MADKSSVVRCSLDIHGCSAIQVNGGSVEEKVDFGYNLFEQTVSVDSVFQPNEMLDTIAITKGKGTEGVVTRWGVTRLPRKTHRGLRKVSLDACFCMLFRYLCDREFLRCTRKLALLFVTKCLQQVVRKSET